MNRREVLKWILVPAGMRPFVGLTAEMVTRRDHIAVLNGGSRSSNAAYMAAFKAMLRTLGHTEEKHYRLDERYANGNFERLPALAKELIARSPSLVLASTTPAALAAKAATTAIPIVFVGVADPLGTGIVDDLARPQGNTTGITNITAELAGKRLELLTEILPGARRIAVLINLGDPNSGPQFRNLQAAARALKVNLDPVLNVRNAAELAAAFEAASRSGAAAAIRMVDPTVTMLRSRIAQLSAMHPLPIIYPFREDAEAGGLIAYGPSLLAQYEQAAVLAHKILQGTPPSSLPIEQPTKFELVINMKSARALGVRVPQSVLLRATRIIE
jgi:putative tryptophan/tyrosine transport system substrate-binding protein